MLTISRTLAVKDQGQPEWKRPRLLSPLDIKVLQAICAHIRLSKPACNQPNGAEQEAKETITVETLGHFGCKAEAYLFYCCSSRENQF